MQPTPPRFHGSFAPTAVGEAGATEVGAAFKPDGGGGGGHAAASPPRTDGEFARRRRTEQLQALSSYRYCCIKRIGSLQTCRQFPAGIYCK